MGRIAKPQTAMFGLRSELLLPRLAPMWEDKMKQISVTAIQGSEFRISVFIECDKVAQWNVFSSPADGSLSLI